MKKKRENLGAISKAVSDMVVSLPIGAVVTYRDLETVIGQVRGTSHEEDWRLISLRPNWRGCFEKIDNVGYRLIKRVSR